MKLQFIINQDNILVKDFLKAQGFSRTFLRKVRLNNCLFVNGDIVKNYYQLHHGDTLIIKIDEQLNEQFCPNEMKLDIIWEDEYLLIVNKPRDLASQPSRKHFTDNLISVITNYYQKNKIDGNIHLVNRLDYSTSGLVIVAKYGLIHHLLSQQKIVKKYLCVVEGVLNEKKGKINFPIKRIEEYNIKRWVFPDGKPSLTYYQVIKEFHSQSLLEVEIATGRTHQIRVHMAYQNHPLIGDKLYGKGGMMLFLHCYYLKLIHPITKERLEIKNYPNWYEEVINA